MLAVLVLVGVPFLILFISSFFMKIPYNTPSEGYDFSQIKYRSFWE